MNNIERGHTVIDLPVIELFNDRTMEFIRVPATELELEHSLYSISKWESKWGKPFLSKDGKTDEMMIDYIRCMTVNPEIDDRHYQYMSRSTVIKIFEYVNSPMTATWFRDSKNKGKDSRVLTSELIYYYLISLNIPIECEHWHLNTLLTLIQVFNEENKPAKNTNRVDLAARRELNRARRESMKTKG